jgi:signal transduction histidine kinase
MKKCFKILLLSLLPVFSMAQQSVPDSLRLVLQNSTSDSVRYLASMELGYYFSENNRDSSLLYYEAALLIAQKNKKKLAEASSLGMKSYQLTMKGRYSESLKCLFQSFSIINESETEENSWMFSPGFSGTPGTYRAATLARSQGIYSALMRNTQNSEQELIYLKESIKTGKKINYLWRVAVSDLNLGMAYLKLNKPDSALIFGTEALKTIRQTNEKKYESGMLILLGEIYLKKGDKLLAKQYYYAGMQSAQHNNGSSYVCWGNFTLTKYYLEERNKDSSLYYATKTFETYLFSATPSNVFTIGDVYENLFKSYQLRNRFDSAYKYQGLTLAANDSIYKGRIKSLADFQNVGFKEQLRLQELVKERRLTQSRNRMYAVLAGLALFLVIALMLYRNNRQKQKANKILESTLTELKSTQSQLIQSEKMASLGELTAGIDHEIQNPLNFVNNFSEVNTELIDEAGEEIDKGNISEAKIILNDIKENEQKINHHGKRADAIVKGMLQHSRSSSGVKEPTDINALADEYLRLAYHGLRAKDKTFNATMKTDFDESIGNINIIPQDIGRVILNLITNAFYEVDRKKKRVDSDYSPTVSVSTKRENGNLMIGVKDNADGIPQKVLDKIFQPFFTTKPTGQGTGLGLSLSYDIVKAHGGELKVETKEGEGSAFIIQLPI